MRHQSGEFSLGLLNTFRLDHIEEEEYDNMNSTEDAIYSSNLANEETPSHSAADGKKAGGWRAIKYILGNVVVKLHSSLQFLLIIATPLDHTSDHFSLSPVSV